VSDTIGLSRVAGALLGDSSVLQQSEVEFGSLLRRFRLAAGFSQEALAERAGLSADAVAALERGRRSRPRPYTVRLLADALGLEAHDRAALIEAGAPQAPTSAAPVTNAPLPVPLTTFVGREHELTELRQHLRGARLLTLTGPGGTGKTRLAIELASLHTHENEGPASFVALDGVREPELVAQEVAGALTVREEPGLTALETLARRLRDAEGLVVLDSCEHVLAAAAAVAQTLLLGCPRLRLLATSRKVLGLPSEVTWRVPSLRLPPSHPVPDLAALGVVESVRLFVERASLAQPAFRLTADSAGDVVGICRRLDGIPLAIELAAARARVLTPAQVLERLEDASSLLTGGSRAATPRQRTLRATIEWSYELLEPEERIVFDRLSVFSGGFQLEAAEAVAGVDVLDALASLVDQSLVIAEPGPSGDMRYRLLEVLRQFGQARLAERGESDGVRLAHAEHYLHLARAADPELRTGDRTALRRLRLEHANFHAALEWARTQTGDLLLRLATALGRYWDLNGSVTEGGTWLDRALATPGGDPGLRATALLRAGRLAFLSRDYGQAGAHLAASLEIKRDQGDEAGVARRLNAMATVAMAHGDRAAAGRLCEEALTIMVRLNDRHGMAWSRMFLGWAALETGDPARAEQRFREAEELHRVLGNPGGLVYDLGGLAVVRIRTRDLGAARALVAEMVDLVRRLEGMPEEPGWVWTCLVLASAERRNRSVMRLAGAIQAIEDHGVHWNQTMVDRFKPIVERARKELGADEADHLRAEGVAMPLDDVLAEALAEP
jgi:predicted ATPase/transcriptional regulator with XRE-family HTH domain